MTKHNMELASVLCMQGGRQEGSYACHSAPQNYAFHNILKPHLSRIIDSSISFESSEYLCLADFGCSTGRNALDCANSVVEKIRSRVDKYKEIFYFFSDLSANDFNMLFRLLECEQLHKTEHTRYYAAGVPGSFHGRLFPDGSLHFAISLFSLQWLSQVPSEVLQRDSPAWNADHVWINGQRPATARAYAQQFHRDFSEFLRCRAKECSIGALLYLVILGRAEAHPGSTYLHACSNAWGHEFESTWEEMISEGLLSKKVRETFNIPVYPPCRSEVEDVVATIPEFHIQELKLMEALSLQSVSVEQQQQQEGEVLNCDPYKEWVGFARCLTEPLVEAHIGSELTTEFFKRFERKAREIKTPDECATHKIDILCAVLVRK